MFHPVPSGFDYHMKLHYSQTRCSGIGLSIRFDYHMKLHYSQTLSKGRSLSLMFDYHMKLHYSQTGLFIFLN